MGVMVMDEAFDEWQQGWDRGLMDTPYGKNKYGYSLYFEQWFETDLRAMVRRDRNHPSIIMWSIGNEIPELYYEEGIALVKKMTAVCKQEDATRPVTVCAEGNHLLRIHDGIMDEVDVAGFNYVNSREGKAYYSSLHREHPDWVLLGSETEYEQDHWRHVTENPYVIGQFLWVGYDYLGEGADLLGEDANLGNTFDIAALAGSNEAANERGVRHGWAFGLVDVTHEPKGEYFYRQSLWTDEPMLRLAVKQEAMANKAAYGYFQSQAHWNWNQGETKTLLIFTNCDSVELFRNNESLGVREADKQSVYAMEWEVDYEPGTITAIGFNQGVKVSEHALATTGSAHGIHLASECGKLRAGGKDHAEIGIRIVDEHGSCMPSAANRVSVRVKGCGTLLGVLSADLTSNESYRSDSCKAFNGKCTAVVVASRQAGPIDIEVVSEGLPPASLRLLTQ